MKNIFKHFESISKIPRCSGNEKKISDFLVEFGRNLGFEVIQEDSLNVIIKKPATKGYENAKTVILQGHMDMVCTKEAGVDFNFDTDPIELLREGDILRANKTTLGADNGIAVAMIMSILEDTTLSHPQIIALITSEEETGMDGVLNLNAENITGDILINIDSEDEGTALASCAGGVKNVVELQVYYKESNKDNSFFKVSITGLRGGHSGIEIDKKRANAIKLLGRLLEDLDKELDIEVAYVSGGEKMNAIAKMSEAIISVKSSDKDELEKLIEKSKETFRNEFQTPDPDIEIVFSECDKSDEVFDEKSKKALINILRLIPDGIESMSASIEGLVESSNNVGVLETEDGKVIFSNAIRSSVKSLKDELNSRISIIAELNNAKMTLIADYPEWEYKVESSIRDLMKEVYKEKFGDELKVDAIHAGLECGFLKEKLGDIDMISIGPDIRDVHTPKEYLSISSTERVYDFLVEVLSRIK